jgi:hypothetical protein
LKSDIYNKTINMSGGIKVPVDYENVSTKHKPPQKMLSCLSSLRIIHESKPVIGIEQPAAESVGASRFHWHG